jgi:Na+/H+ antiporter 1
MSEDPQSDAKLARLPTGFVDRLTKPFAHFFRIEAAAGSVLLLFTVAALVLSNSPWSHSFLGVWETPTGIRIGSFDFVRSLREWINDGAWKHFEVFPGGSRRRTRIRLRFHTCTLSPQCGQSIGGFRLRKGTGCMSQFLYPRGIPSSLTFPNEPGRCLRLWVRALSLLCGCLALVGRCPDRRRTGGKGAEGENLRPHRCGRRGERGGLIAADDHF